LWTGQQIPEWQTNVFCDHLKRMLRCCAVDPETSVEDIIQGAWRVQRVKDWIASGERPDEPGEDLCRRFLAQTMLLVCKTAESDVDKLNTLAEMLREFVEGR
jgi:hypothetical protein